MSIKAIPFILFLGLFVLFASPIGTGIINLGNGVGMALSALLMLITLFWGRFTDFVGRCWEKPLGKVLVCAVALFTVISIVLAVIISISMAKEANDPPKDENTTVVVLGCKVKEGRPSLMLSRRLDAAYGYLSEHESVCAVVSGGKGSDESISEAQCMRDYLVGRGIAPKRIFMEDKSVNTEENLKFSKEIIERNGLPKTITLVTDNFHQYRAELIAESYGIEAYNISGKTSWYLLPTYCVREWFGVVYYKLFG